MSDSILITLGLLALNAFQLVYWSRQIQKLVDKLMSRNYYEYRTASQVSDTRDPETKVIIEQEPLEDLGPLQGFNF